MRRFERIQPAVPERRGVNPFTKQPMVFAGRPERTTRCDVELEGSDVREEWTWFKGDTPSGKPRCKVHRFPDRERAEADLEEVVAELLHDGFRELTPDEMGSRDARLPEKEVVSRAGSDVARLPAAIIERCRQRGWFGHDMALKPNFVRPKPDTIEWKRFRYAPASEAQLAETERMLGFRLPSTLRTIYANVANGGFGPGYGFVGVIGGAPDSIFETHLADAYRQEREASRLEEPLEEWPRRVLRFVEWGCAIWSCIDARTGHVLRYEPLSEVPEKDMIPEADSLEEWLERWLRGDELFYLAGHQPG